MKKIICKECFHNSCGNCKEGCADYMDTDYCDKFIENEDIGPIDDDLGQDYLEDGISNKLVRHGGYSAVSEYQGL